MIRCERIPLAAVGKKAVRTRINTGGQLGGYCGGPGKRRVTWSTAVMVGVKGFRIRGQIQDIRYSEQDLLMDWVCERRV